MAATEYVTCGAVRLPIRRHSKGWRVSYPDSSKAGGWGFIYRSNKDKAKQAGHAKAVEIANGALDLTALTPGDMRLVRDFLALKPTRADVERLRTWHDSERVILADAVTRYRSEFPEKLKKHHKELFATLANISGDLGATMLTDLGKPELHEWLLSHDIGPKRWNNLRGMLVQFSTWAKREMLVEAPNGLTPADRIPRRKVPKKGEIRFASGEEMGVMLESVDPDFLPWLVLGGFCAIRSEEIAPRTENDKPPLDWSAVNLKKGCVTISATVSKVGKRRVVPITPAALAWLNAMNPPRSGKIAPCSPSKARGKTKPQTVRLGEALDAHFGRAEGWPPTCSAAPT